MNKLKMLIIDDKKVIGDIFNFTLGYDDGHNIVWVNNAVQAMDLVTTQKFDIVFIDVVMPNKDGVTLLEEIKSIKPDLPIVMMSGYSLNEKREKINALGATACIRKPFEMDEIRKIIEEAVGSE